MNIKIRLPILAAALAVILAPAHATTIDPSNYDYSMSISPAAGRIATTLSNFPLLVRLSSTRQPWFNPADCGTGGADLRFALADGTLLADQGLLGRQERLLGAGGERRRHLAGLCCRLSPRRGGEVRIRLLGERLHRDERRGGVAWHEPARRQLREHTRPVCHRCHRPSRRRRSEAAHRQVARHLLRVGGDRQLQHRQQHIRPERARRNCKEIHGCQF